VNVDIPDSFSIETYPIAPKRRPFLLSNRGGKQKRPLVAGAEGMKKSTAVAAAGADVVRVRTLTREAVPTPSPGTLRAANPFSYL